MAKLNEMNKNKTELKRSCINEMQTETDKIQIITMSEPQAATLTQKSKKPNGISVRKSSFFSIFCLFYIYICAFAMLQLFVRAVINLGRRRREERPRQL